MPFEDEFSQALREAAYSTPPTPVVQLASVAAQRGRRRKRRNAVLASVAAVVTVTCVGVLALQLNPASDVASPGSTARPAAAVPSGAATATVPSVVPSTSAGPGSARPSSAPLTNAGTTNARTTNQAQASADQFGALFTSKLPASLQLSSPMLSKQTHDPQLVAVYAAKDGDHQGSVEIDISKAGSHGPQSTAGPCSHPVPDCTTTTEPDGSTLTLYLPTKDAYGEQIWGAAKDAHRGEQVWSAFLRRPDGSVVMVESGNLQPSANLPHQVYANSPLLDGTQLTAIALDPAWQPLIAGLGSATTG
jgi:hypothetical protein